MGIFRGIVTGTSDLPGVNVFYENDDPGAGSGAPENTGDNTLDAGEQDPGWLAGLPQDLREAHGEKLRGYKKVGDFVKEHLDKSSKYENAVVLPGENATPEEIQAYREKMGIPPDTTGYELQEPENLPEGVQIDGQLKSWFAEAAHKQGLSNKQAKELYAEFNNLQVSRIQQAREAQQQQVKAQKDKVERELRETYGDSMEAKLEDAKRVYNKVFDDGARAELDKMGLGANPAFLKAMIQLSDRVSEDNFFDGSSSGDGLPDDDGFYYENTPGMRKGEV